MCHGIRCYAAIDLYAVPEAPLCLQDRILLYIFMYSIGNGKGQTMRASVKPSREFHQLPAGGIRGVKKRLARFAQLFRAQNDCRVDAVVGRYFEFQPGWLPLGIKGYFVDDRSI